MVLDVPALQKKLHPARFPASNEPSMWRYLPLLPVGDPGAWGTPLRRVGNTPVYNLPELAAHYGFRNLWVKDESPNPTASFKDRASALVVAHARESLVGPGGAQSVIVTASTGNAGAALAGMGAAVGHPVVIFAPKSAPPAKIAQLLVFGARVFLVEGSYDDAVGLALQASQQFGWYCRNTAYNPFTAEGKKTAAFEIWEYFVRQGLPINQQTAIFVSVGDGNIIAGIHKGFRDLLALGWIEQAPRIFGVQADGSAAIANAFRQRSETILPVSAHTLADSISVDLPADGVRAVRAAFHTGGAYLTVSDEQILQAIPRLGRIGVFAEPAGAAAFAGMEEAARLGLLGPGDTVLVLNTGSGLKDVRAAAQSVSQAPVIPPELSALSGLLDGLLFQ